MTLVASSTLAFAVAGCGGGEGGSSNTAPTFSSAATASFVENGTAAAYQAIATDAQRDAITFTIEGGADAAAFTIAPGGALSFVTPPNYDLPTDANGDNVYQVTLKASDGKADSTLAVAITVTNDREGIRAERIATNLTDPVGIMSLDAGSHIIVALKANTITRIVGRDGVQSVYHTFPAEFTLPGSGLSLRGLAKGKRAFLDRPGFYDVTFILGSRNGRAWAACLRCTPFSMADIVDEAQAGQVSIGTGPDGNAYVAVGDPDGSSAQDPYSPLGKLIRFEPFPEGYDIYAGASIPPDFYKRTVAGSGLRAPTGVAPLPGGSMLVSDRGGSDFDELSLTSDLGVPNFGWPYFEGTREKRAGGAALPGLVTPSLVVPLGSEPRQSRGIVGGLAYTGPIPGIANHYVFADKDGRIWSIPLARLSGTATLQASALELRTEDFVPDAGTIDHPVAMTVDAEGSLYIIDADGELFRIPAPGLTP